MRLGEREMFEDDAIKRMETERVAKGDRRVEAWERLDELMQATLPFLSGTWSATLLQEYIRVMFREIEEIKACLDPT